LLFQNVIVTVTVTVILFILQEAQLILNCAGLINVEDETPSVSRRLFD
jgi:hypothetical protein